MEKENPNNVKCDRCNSTRLMDVYVQGRDTHNFNYGGMSYQGYSKEGIGLYGNYGDALDFQVCMQCGKVQGDFPKNDEKIKQALSEEDEE